MWDQEIEEVHLLDTQTTQILNNSSSTRSLLSLYETHLPRLCGDHCHQSDCRCAEAFGAATAHAKLYREQPPSGFTTASGGTANIMFSSAGANFNGSSTGSRDYIRTSGTAYNTINFTATIHLINNSLNSGVSNGGAFIGFGSGGQGTFQEPDTNNGIYLRLTDSNAQVLVGGPFGSTAYQFTNPAQGDSLTVGYTYTTATNSINFILNDLTTNTMQTSGAIALTNSVNNTDSSVFFGGGGNGTSDPLFNNLSIVPEPSTWVMLSLCGIGATVSLVRRRARATQRVSVL